MCVWRYNIFAELSKDCAPLLAAIHVPPCYVDELLASKKCPSECGGPHIIQAARPVLYEIVSIEMALTTGKKFYLQFYLEQFNICDGHATH